MGKFLLELALFAGILCQISMLTGYAKNPAQATETVKSFKTSSLEAMLNGGSYTMDPSQITPAAQNTAILQELARKEAERIVQTGDYESFYKRLEENKTVLNLMGHGL